MKTKSRRGVRSADFEIDLHQLDKEWLKQPELYFHYAEMLADARLDYENARTRQEIVQAEVDAEIRARPKKFGLKNVTEPAIKARIKTVDAYADAEKEVAELRHRVDVIQGAVTTLDHKKRALEKLVDLHGQNYFSEPRAPVGAKDVIADAKMRRAKPLDDDDD